MKAAVAARTGRSKQKIPIPVQSGSPTRSAKPLALAAWVGYIVVVAAGVVRHEPWSDEAQAWLLARDASIMQLFTDLLRSEGSPGLWHAILLLPAKLGLPYFTGNVIAAVLGATAAFLVFRHSPFPLPVKLLLPFTFFLSYQYAVVARNYALLPPVIFGIALAYPSRDTRPFRFAVLLALLANVSAQGFCLRGAWPPFTQRVSLETEVVSGAGF